MSGLVPRIFYAKWGCDVNDQRNAHQILGTSPRMTIGVAAQAVHSWRLFFAGLLLAVSTAPAYALDLPATHQVGKLLHPGHYACLDDKTPTSEFDILDGNAYFLRGTTLRAGEFAYDKVTGLIRWKSGPFADVKVTAYNTVRVVDKKPVIILRFEPPGEDPSTEYCTIVE